MTDRADITVIGAGVLGLSIAAELLQRDRHLEVAVLDGPGAGASRAAGAMLGCVGEVTAATLRSPLSRSKLELGLTAADMWPDRLEQLGLPASAAGTVVVANTRSGVLEDENFDAILTAAETYGVRHEPIDSSDAPLLRPVDDARPSRAVFLPDEQCTDARGLLVALRAEVERMRPAAVRPHDARRVLVDHGRVTGVDLADGTRLPTDHVIFAAGAVGQHLLDDLREAVPIPRLLAGAGAALTVADARPADGPVIRTPNRSFACGLHAVPSSNGTYIGATNELRWTPETQPTVGDLHFLMTCAIEQIDHRIAAAPVRALHCGNRPVSFDTLPLLGPTTVDGLHLVTGTYRDGIQLSPLLASNIASNLLDDADCFPDAFRPVRPLTQLWTFDDAVAETTKHYRAVAAEHGARMPAVGWNDMLTEMLERQVRAVYDAIDRDFVVAPDLISMIDSDRPALVPLVQAEIDRLSTAA